MTDLDAIKVMQSAQVPDIDSQADALLFAAELRLLLANALSTMRNVNPVNGQAAAQLSATRREITRKLRAAA